MKKTIVLIIVIVLVAGIGFGAGYFVGKGPSDSKAEQYKKIIDYYFPNIEPTNSVSGKITAIGNDYLNLETIIQDPYVLPTERKTSTIKILISANTKITKFDARTGKNIDIKTTDLKINDQIGAFSDISIKDKSEFTAKSINLYTAP